MLFLVLFGKIAWKCFLQCFPCRRSHSGSWVVAKLHWKANMSASAFTKAVNYNAVNFTGKAGNWPINNLKQLTFSFPQAFLCFHCLGNTFNFLLIAVPHCSKKILSEKRMFFQSRWKTAPKQSVHAKFAAQKTSVYKCFLIPL